MKEGRNPVFEDKEPVREWGRIVRTPKGQGINSLNPEDPEDLEFVAALRIPRKVVENMTERYLNISPRLTGMSLSQYQKEEMHI
ncbi:hypothetical protein IIB97_02165 [Patescibacteria group bacterium]|nr:hypothetical protein [Patescibacteria group bacterium]